MCRECGHRTASPARHEAHLTSPRHIHSFRWQAYQDPRRRAMWLRLWAAEEERARELRHMEESFRQLKVSDLLA